MKNKEPTQPEVDHSRKGRSDGTNRPEGNGQSAGGAYPDRSAEDGRKEPEHGLDRHGGQSVIGYHGPQQLGEEEIEPGGNPNAGSKSG